MARGGSQDDRIGFMPKKSFVAGLPDLERKSQGQFWKMLLEREGISGPVGRAVQEAISSSRSLGARQRDGSYLQAGRCITWPEKITIVLIPWSLLPPCLHPHKRAFCETLTGQF